MRAWVAQHRAAFASAVRRLSWLNALVIGVALALPAGGYALLDSLRPASARLALEPRISLFLEPQVKRAEAEALGKRLRADRRIGSVRFVTREEALKDMSSVQGMAEVIAALGRNPLPDAYVVTSKEDIAGELAKLPGVAHVQADAVWARRLAAAAAVVELAIARTDPGVRGDTAQGGTKPATLETGAVVPVPPFIEPGEIIRVDTREAKYLERVNK